MARAGVHEILDDYIQRDPNQFRRARHGFLLDEEDRQRRFVMMSLLQAEGLSQAAFQQRFSVELPETFPQLQALIHRGLATCEGDLFRLTPAGMELSDAIGPWLFSEKVVRLMEAHQCR